MPIFLNEDQLLFQESARKFAEAEVAPLANQIDTEDKVPVELISKIAEQGYFGLYISEQYGGMGKSLTASCVVLEEIAKASPSLAGLLSVQIVMCPGIIDRLGNDEQRERLLVPSARGENLMIFSITEPSGALNIPTHQTRLEADGESYRLNGYKLFSTQGSGSVDMVAAKTRRNGVEGYTWAIVDMNAEGVSVAPHESKLGWRGTSTGSVAFDNVTIRPEDILGDFQTAVGDTFSNPMVSFVSHSVTSLGCAQGLLDRTVEYVNERNLYGEPMARLQPIGYWLAEVQAKIHACRALVYNTARHYDEGGTDSSLASVCKGYVCDTAFDCCHRLLQMWGGGGMMDSTGVNRYFRDARVKQVAEAASEYHYSVIADALLAQPQVSFAES